MHPPTDEFINNLWYIDTMKYFSVLKRKKILKHAETWMNLVDMNKFCMIQLK